MRRLWVADGVPADVGGLGGAGLGGVADGSGRPPGRNGRVQPVQTAKVAAPGEIVTVGHWVVVPSPHRTNWLTLIVSVVAGSAAVSAPECAGDTLTTWSGSLATETDQLTVPPDARSETSEPGNPGTTISVPPSGSADSVPGGGLGGGGVRLDLAGAGDAAVSVGAGGLAFVGAGGGPAAVGVG
jgi:hypothetical protein